MTEGINIKNISINQTVNLKFTLLACCVDSVARPVCQNRVQFNAFWGCSWCFAPGTYFAKSMRYPLTENDPDLRTNLRYKEDVKNVVRLNKNFVPRRRKTYKGTNYTPKK